MTDLDDGGKERQAESIFVDDGEQPLGDPSPPADPVEDNVPEPAGVTVRSGEALTVSEAAALMSAVPAHVIAVVGPVDSGKTTLLATIWEALQRGPFHKHIFAGSRTLVGFERRCFDARIESGREEPETPRTSVGDPNRVLHLAVRRGGQLGPRSPGGDVCHLLFTDVSGEELEQAVTSADAARSFPLVRRADHVVVLVDGRKLVEPPTRYAALNALSMFRRFVEVGAVGTHTYAHFAISKNDLVSQVGGHAEAFAARTLEKALEEFEGRVGRLTVGRLAARPRGAASASGVSSLFESWVAVPPRLARNPAPPARAQPSDRASSLWGIRNEPVRSQA